MFTAAHRRLARRSSAFTLIELLVVIVILGILMAVAVPTFLSQQQKAQDSKTQQQLATAYKAIRSQLSSFNNQYPATASVVSAIAASEPELTVSSGSCNASTSDKQVVVDNVLTGPDKLSLYAKSGDGYWWNLTASASSAPVFTRLGTCQGPLATGALSVTGTPITDASRSDGSAVDGLSGDSSYGIWQQSSNVITLAGMTTQSYAGLHGYNATDFSNNYAEPAPDYATTGYIRIPELGPTAQNIEVFAGSTYPVSSGQVWTESMELRSDAPLNISGLQITFFTNNGHHQIPVNYIALGNNTYFIWATYTVGSTDTYIRAPDTISWQNVWKAATYVDIRWAQLEQQPSWTPFVGYGATRTPPVITAPASALNATQGWVAMRVRMGFPNTASASFDAGYAFLFDWRQDSNDRLTCNFNLAITGKWAMNRWNGGNDDGAGTVAVDTFNAGDFRTVVCAWTASSIGISYSGNPFNWVTATHGVPTISASTFTVGAATGGGTQLDGDVLWFACGTGTLSNSDVATINSWGNQDPTTQDFPQTAQATLAWSADTSRYVTGN